MPCRDPHSELHGGFKHSRFPSLSHASSFPPVWSPAFSMSLHCAHSARLQDFIITWYYLIIKSKVFGSIIFFLNLRYDILQWGITDGSYSLLTNTFRQSISLWYLFISCDDYYITIFQKKVVSCLHFSCLLHFQFLFC